MPTGSVDIPEYQSLGRVWVMERLWFNWNWSRGVVGIVKIALLIEYEGTRYHGFQLQRSVPTIQGELEQAISRVTGEVVRLRGAGRTDAGVHARGQVATFDTESTLSAETFVKALNHYLPPDIGIKDSCQVVQGFDPRRSALSREYRYTISNSPTPSPLIRGWAWHIAVNLNIDVMNHASALLEGEHDFAPFTNSEGGRKNTKRTVFKAAVERNKGFIIFDMIASAFLPQQVRRTVGSLVKVGAGKMTVGEFREMASSAQIGLAKTTAPPHGLCLERVNYSDIGFVNYENI